MTNFEQELIGRMPLEEASAFFIGIRKYGWAKQSGKQLTKVASTEAQLVIKDLLAGKMPPGKAGHFKTASTEKPEKTDAELKEEGRRRAVTTMASEAHRERARRGERIGDTLGRAVGAVKGGTLASRLVTKNPLARVAGVLGGAAVGSSVGGKIGKEIGTEVDIRKNASARLHLALAKMAQGEMGPAAQMAPPDAGEAAVVQSGTPAPEQMTPTPQPSAPLMPVNYFGAEVLARKAQESNELNFLRERLQRASEEQGLVQQQLEQTQSEIGNLQAQLAEMGPQMQVAQQQAMSSNERAMMHSQEAANMRMGMQQMREQMLQIASQDPEAITQQAQQAAQEEMMAAGSPEGAPAPGGGAPPGTPAAGAGAAQGGVEEPSSGESGVSTAEGTSKTGSTAAEITRVAPYAAAGAGLASLRALMEGHKVPAFQENVERLEGEEGGFGHALRLAKAKMQLARAELAEEHPTGAAARSAVGGAVTGAVMGPIVARFGKNVASMAKKFT